MVVVDKTIYALGGHDGMNYLSSVEVTTLTDNEWKPIAPMSQARYKFSAAKLDRYIFVTGGWNGGPLNSPEKHDTKTHRWTWVAGMKETRRAPGMIAFNGGLLAFGGYKTRHVLFGTAGSYSCSFESYDIERNVWTKEPFTMPECKEDFACIVI